MLDSGGGGSAGTSWWSKDIATMWYYIADVDTEPMWKQSSGWQKAIDLASTNLSRLKDFREKLTTAWPPEKSEASQAYVAKLDELITSVQDVYDAAITNKTSASNLASAISEAKYKVKPLYDSWLDTLSQDQDDPAVKQRQEDLTNQARGHMSDLSTDLILSQGNMVEPKPYTPPQLAKRDGGDETGGSNSSSSTTGTGSSGYTGSNTAPIIPMPAPMPAPSGPGPSLSGWTQTPPTAPAPTPMPTAPTVPGGPGPIGMGPPTPPLGPNGLIKTPTTGPTGPITAGRPPGPLGPNVIGGGPPGRTTPGLTGPMGRGVNPPGGVIGGQPPGGRGGTTGLGTRGVNPAGGVVGGSGARGAGAGPGGVRGAGAGPGGVRGAGAGATGRGAGMVGSGVGGNRKNEDEHGNEWDPDNPWEVAEGVAPVVNAPGETGPIDPGPAIGGRW